MSAEAQDDHPVDSREPRAAIRIAEIFDMEGMLRAASPYQLHPVLVTTTDAVEVLSGNLAIERRLGFKLHELSNGTASKLFESAAEFRRAASFIRRALAGGETGCFGFFAMRRANGSSYTARLLVTFVRELRSERILAVVVIRDTTAADRLDDTYSRFGMDLHTISSNLPGGLFQRILTIDGAIQYVFLRGQVLDRLGIQSEAIERDSSVLLDRMHPDDRWVFEDALEQSALHLKPIDIVLRYTTLSREQIRVRTLSQPRQLDDGDIIWDGIMLEVGEEYEATIRHQQLAYCDELTGLLNTAAFRILLDAVVADRQQVVVAAINLRKQSNINQVLGIEGGNEMIRQVAARLVEAVGRADRVARTPTGNFLVCVDAESRDSVDSIGETLLAAISKPVFLNGPGGVSTPVSASIGMTYLPDDGKAPHEVLMDVEMALDRARASTTNCVCKYSTTLRAELLEETQLEQDLCAAIEAEVIKPYYQPQFDLNTGKVIGIEALARWKRDDTFVSPMRFIPLAERTGLIGALGRLVFLQVIRDIRAWRKQFHVPRVFVNVSGLHLCESDFSTWYCDTIARARINIDDIGVELTETTFLLNLESAKACMQRLAEAGVSFSMDDFGTGFSSLSHLANLPFSTIKIDRAFVDGIESSDCKCALVDSIIRIGAGLGLQVVAEGVESAQQVVVLRTLGCSAAQGYYFSRPVPAADVCNWLEPKVQ